MSEQSINITLASTDSGLSETLPLSTTTTTDELIDFARALLGLEGDLVLFKDGRRLSSGTLGSLGVRDGDLVAVQKAQAARPAPAPSGGGLDFSALLAQGSSPASSTPRTVYYPGMNIDEAIAMNPHPSAFITVLRANDHLAKELNYHNPRLAGLIQGQPFETAVQIWRDELVKGGIQKAMHVADKFHTEQTMQQRLSQNPDDPEAKEFFRKKEADKLIQQQYHQMMEEYPESLGRVLMLYIDTKVNGRSIQAFCDSGAQSTIFSKRTARECGLLDLVDTRFAGTAVGVGTSKILGRIHVVQLQIGEYYFPCSVTVMDDPPPGASEMPFLLGLDMMKRHTCIMDLEKGVLKFRVGQCKYLEAPFLHEKDLDESQGGTRGFDVEAANREFLKLQEEEDAKDDHDAMTE